MTTLIEAVDQLQRRYAPPTVPTDPFELILWENIGYLIDDERRRKLFDLFAESVGLSPLQIAKAKDSVLLTIAVQGGMRPEIRIERWRKIASIIMEQCGGDLRATLAHLPALNAISLLKRFPTIGDPGADKILLFSRIEARPAVDSNGLRTLARLGFIDEQSSYSRSYALAVDVLANQGLREQGWLLAAYHGLREHGKSLCKRSQPLCGSCPLDTVCLHRDVKTL